MPRVAKRFTLRIDLGNDAMRTTEDIRKALITVIDQLGGVSLTYTTVTHASGMIRDVNGNRVGRWDTDDGD